MITHRNSLDICPGGVPLFIRLSQYDSSFTLIFDLFSHKGTFTVESGTTARFRELKPDGNAISIDATINGTTVTLAPSQANAQQMTAIAGNCKCELSLFKGDKELNTANFTLLIEKAVIDKDTPYSDSVIRELIDVTDRADEIMEAAEIVRTALSKKVVNRFDPSTITSGKVIYSTSDGVPVAREGFSVSDYIDIHDLSPVLTIGAANLAWYDSTKAYISFGGATIWQDVHTHTPPTGAYYLRLSIDDRRLGNVEVASEISRKNYIAHDKFSIEDLVIYHDQIITPPDTKDTRPYVTPEEYGAVADGVTDCTSAISAAIRDASLRGKFVQFGRGVYKANLAITTDNVTLVGCGMDATRIVPATLDSPIFKVNVDTAETTSDLISFITVKDLCLYGDNQAVIGLSIRCSQSCFFERVRIDRCYTGGIVLTGVFDSRFTNCDILRSGNTGFQTDDGLNNYSIVIDRTTGMNTNAVVFEGCRTEHAPRMLSIQNSQQMMFSNCKFESHCGQFSSVSDYAPINAGDNVYGINFVNCLLTYNGLMSDSTQQDNFNSGNPFIRVITNGITNGNKPCVLFSGCQFRTQPNYAVRYFVANYTRFADCTFDRCSGINMGNLLKDYSVVDDCDFVVSVNSRAMILDGNYIIVDNARVHTINPNVNREVIYLAATLTRGYVKVLYTGEDRANLAGGTINVPVEFIGQRTYPA